MSTEALAAAPAAPKANPPGPGVSESKAAAARADLAKQFFPKDPAAAPPAIPAAAPAAKVEAKPAAAAPEVKPAPVSGDDAPPPVPSILKKPDAPKPAEPALVEGPEDKLPEPKSPEAQAGWKELKKIAKEARTQAADLERQLADARKAAPAATAAQMAEIEQIKADLKAAQDRLLVVDLQAHPDFVRQYGEPKKKALAVATEVLGYNGKENVEVGAILAKPLKEFNAALSEFTAGMNPADAGMVMQALRQARELQQGETSALANSRQVHEQLTAKAVQAQKQAFEAVASDVVPSFAKREVSDSMTAEEKASVVAYNQSVDSLRSRAEARAFGALKERDVATMAFKEAAFDHAITHAVPYLESHIAGQNKVIAALAAELKALKGGKAPTLNAGVVPEGGAAPEKKSIEQLAREAFRA